jgi:hypothetical protein
VAVHRRRIGDHARCAEALCPIEGATGPDPAD